MFQTPMPVWLRNDRPMNVHTISRLPSAAYVIQRTLTPETVGADKAHKAHWPVAQAILDALAAAGWRLVPGRVPEARHHEVAAPPMIEGQLTTRQLINSAAVFDDIAYLLLVAQAAEALLATGFTADGDFLTQNSIPMGSTPGVRRKVTALRAALEGEVEG